MRTYLILKDKARRFREDREVQSLLTEIRAGDAADAALPGAYNRETATKLKSRRFDRATLAVRALPYERLDQLVVDLLLGAR
jgi:xylose isomerase